MKRLDPFWSFCMLDLWVTTVTTYRQIGISKKFRLPRWMDSPYETLPIDPCKTHDRHCGRFQNGGTSQAVKGLRVVPLQAKWANHGWIVWESGTLLIMVPQIPESSWLLLVISVVSLQGLQSVVIHVFMFNCEVLKLHFQFTLRGLWTDYESIIPVFQARWRWPCSWLQLAIVPGYGLIGSWKNLCYIQNMLWLSNLQIRFLPSQMVCRVFSTKKRRYLRFIFFFSFTGLP